VEGLLPCDALSSHAFEWGCKKTLGLEELLVSGRSGEDGWALLGMAIALVVCWARKGHSITATAMAVLLYGTMGFDNRALHPLGSGAVAQALS